MAAELPRFSQGQVFARTYLDFRWGRDRSGVVVEPWLTPQWFCDARVLAQPAIAAVEEGRTRFVPRQWENTFFEWMRNIQPWCISRQLWWGHRIPAWYGPDDAVFVAETEAEAQQQAVAKYGMRVALRRDERFFGINAG